VCAREQRFLDAPGIAPVHVARCCVSCHALACATRQVELRGDLVGSCVVGDVVTVLGMVKVLATGDGRPTGALDLVVAVVCAASGCVCWWC
jgi:hypothetical protein